LKEEALDRTLWRTRFGKGYGPVVRQTTEWMNDFLGVACNTHVLLIYRFLAVPWLRWLVTGLSPRRPGLDPGSVHVGFVVDKLALRQVLLRVLRCSPVNFIPPVLH
jgi:hypothetical protein